MDDLIDGLVFPPADTLIEMVTGSLTGFVAIQTIADHDSAPLDGGQSDVLPRARILRKAEFRTMSWPDRCNERHLSIHWLPGIIDPNVAGPRNPRGLVSVPAVYVDLDGSRMSDLNGPSPNLKVDSKSGDHLYWLLERPLAPDEAAGVLRAAAIGCRADPAAANPYGTMRLPGWTHWKDRENPYLVTLDVIDETTRWKPLDLLKALNSRIPNEEDWASYCDWWRASRNFDVPEYDTSDWDSCRAAAVAYLRLITEHKNARLNIEIPDWEVGRVPDYWWGWCTYVRLHRTMLRVLSDADTDRRAKIEAAGRAHAGSIDPDRPEWLAVVEPAARYWIAYVDDEYAAAQATARQNGVEWEAPKVEPFDPALVDAGMLRKAPPRDRTRGSVRQGDFNLRTFDVPSFTAAVGIWKSTKGDGKHRVRCPWSAGHSTDDEATMFAADERPAGFHCFHSSCAGKTMWDVIEHFGEDQIAQFCQRFEVVGGLRTSGYGHPEWPVTYEHKTHGTLPASRSRDMFRSIFAIQ